MLLVLPTHSPEEMCAKETLGPAQNLLSVTTNMTEAWNSCMGVLVGSACSRLHCVHRVCKYKGISTSNRRIKCINTGAESLAAAREMELGQMNGTQIEYNTGT